MGTCCCVKPNKIHVIQEEVKIYKAEVRDIKEIIKEVDQFLDTKKSSDSLNDYPTRVEKLVNRTIDTMTNIHEYAIELYESIITLLKKTNELLNDTQTEITKLVEEIAKQKTEQRQNVGQEQTTGFSYASSRLATIGGFAFAESRHGRQNEVKERDSLLAAKLESVLKSANAFLQYQNLQAIIKKTTEVLRGIQDISEISDTDKTELQDILGEWKRNTKQFEDEIQKKEENEQQKQEEANRKKREQQKKEEEKKRKREEEEQRKREQKEQREKEEKEQREREQEKRRVREEQEQRKREEQRRRKEEEQRQKRRQNPKNWKPFVYDIVDKQLVNDKHNDGVCCVVFAIPDSIGRKDLCCLSSDHSAYNIRECISADEQIASLITNIKSSTYEKLSLECPLRVYIPYHNITEDNRTIAVKVSVDGGKWNRVDTLEPYTLKEKLNLKFVGFEINNFTYIKILAVTIIKPEKVIVPEEGISYTCIGDRDVSFIFPESTFKEPTQISLMTNNISKFDIQYAIANHTILRDVCESTSVISFDCGTATDKPFNLRVRGLKHKGNYEKFNAIYNKKDGKWKLADCKIIGNVAHITIPKDVSKILLIGLTLPRHTPIEEVFDSANEMVKHSNEIKMQVVCKQKSYNWNDAHIACVSSENKTKYVDDLLTQGYAEGPAPSREFCIAEGENIHLRFAGNINIDDESHESKRLTRLKLQSLRSYPDCITCHLSVDDEHRQKQEQYFRGYVNVNYQFEKECTNPQTQVDQLPIYLEKKIPLFQVAATYKVRFAMETNLTALVKYIVWKLNECGDAQDWDHFLHYLDEKSMIRRLKSKIGNGSEHETQRNKCEEFMRFWIKEKPKSIKKVDLIMNVLRESGFDDLKYSAGRFIKVFDENGILSDSSLMKMAEKIGTEWESLGTCLGLTTPEIEQIKMDNAYVRLQIYHMLDTWRLSDHAIELDHLIVTELVDAMTAAGCDSELIDFIRSNSV